MAKRRKTNWKPTDRRFVAFLDILGFKDLVLRSTHKEVYDILYKISITKNNIEKIVNEDDEFEEAGNAGINIVRFSDSIGVFSKSDDLDNFRIFIECVNVIFADAIINGIPLKGGMAYGVVTINQSEQIYFGQPIIDAFILEKEVAYFGVVAHNSIDTYIAEHTEIESKFLSTSFFSHCTPLKSGKIFHRNSHWFNGVLRLSGLSNEKEFVEGIIKGFRRSVSGAPRKYVDNTLEMLDPVQKGVTSTHDNPLRGSSQGFA